MESRILCPTLADLSLAAQTILSDCGDQRIFALSGRMGVGKTSFIKALCKALGVIDLVSSPSFALVNEYLDPRGGQIYHFDFYRIKTIQEVMDLGYEEYFYSGSYCFLEWPELISELLPVHFVYIFLQELEDGSREIVWRIHS